MFNQSYTRVRVIYMQPHVGLSTSLGTLFHDLTDHVAMVIGWTSNLTDLNR